jgi:hypothetical protein
VNWVVRILRGELKKIARAIGSRGAVRWLGVGRTRHPDIKSQCELLIVVSLSHQIISGIQGS